MVGRKKGKEYHFRPLSLRKPPLQLAEQLRTNLIATVPFYRPQNPFSLVMLQKRPTRLIELLQPYPPCFLVVVLPLGQRLARNVIPSVYAGGVEFRIVHTAARGVHPARGNSPQDYVRGSQEGDD